jgi:alpha-1,6-mannosyltransferase
VLALVVLALAAIALAAPGSRFVAGAAADSPRWLQGVFGDGFGLGAGAYSAVLWVAFLAYLAVVAFAVELGARTVMWAIGIGLALFALAPPLLSLDVFSYISYARLGAVHGLNPYDFSPAAIPHDLAASRVEDYRQATSVYGPLFTLITYPLGLLGVPAALWSMKALAALSVAAVSGIVARVAALRGIAPSRAAALVALNPVVLVQVVGGAHNDALMMAAATAGTAMVLWGTQAGGGATLVAATAVKAAGAVTIPFALLGAGGRRERVRLAAGAAAGVAVIGLVALAAFGSSALDGISILSGSQQRVSYHSVPATAARITGIDLGVVRALALVAYGVVGVWLLVWTARGGDWIRAAAWASLGLLLATAYLTPWYVMWALPLVALGRDRTLVILTLALSAYQLTVGVPG